MSPCPWTRAPYFPDVQRQANVAVARPGDTENGMGRGFNSHPVSPT